MTFYQVIQSSIMLYHPSPCMGGYSPSAMAPFSFKIPAILLVDTSHRMWGSILDYSWEIHNILSDMTHATDE